MQTNLSTGVVARLGSSPRRRRWRRPAVLLKRMAALCLATACVASAAPAPASHLLIGVTGPHSGPNAAYGQGLWHGVALAIARANAAGGVNGQHVEMLALDDASDPHRAAENARRLTQQGVVALTGVHGAGPTAAIAAVLAAPSPDSAEPPPLVGPATSDDALRTPPRRGVFHLRAAATEEISAAVLHLDTLGQERFAVLSRADGLGDAARDSVTLELVRIGMRPVATVRLEAAAGAQPVRAAMGTLCTAQPQAIVLALDATLARSAIDAGGALGCKVQYLALSETAPALVARPPNASGPHPLAGLLVTQVMPNPKDLSHPLVAEYQRALSAYGAALGPTFSNNGGAFSTDASLEGYQAARVILEALRGCPRDAAPRSCLQQSLLTRSIDVPGVRFQLGTAQRQSRPFVGISLLDDRGRFLR